MFLSSVCFSFTTLFAGASCHVVSIGNHSVLLGFFSSPTVWTMWRYLTTICLNCYELSPETVSGYFFISKGKLIWILLIQKVFYEQIIN